MNKATAFSVVFLLSVSVYAQKVTVSPQTEKVKKESIEGYGFELEGKREVVNDAYVKFLKDLGKLRQSNNPMTLTEPVLNGYQFPKGTIYAFTRDHGDNTTVWLGIKPGEMEAADVKRANTELQKYLYGFGIKYYRDKIQAQIDDAQEALDAVEKQRQKAISQNKDLTLQLSNNEQEKIQLQKSVESNTYENAVLKVKLDNNKKAQDSLANTRIQIEKVKLMHQDRQRKVN